MSQEEQRVRVQGDVGINALICLNDVQEPPPKEKVAELRPKELTEYEWQLLNSLRTLIRGRINAILEGGDVGEDQEKGQEESEKT